MARPAIVTEDVIAHAQRPQAPHLFRIGQVLSVVSPYISFLKVAGFLGIPLNYFITVKVKGRSTTARRDAN